MVGEERHAVAARVRARSLCPRRGDCGRDESCDGEGDGGDGDGDEGEVDGEGRVALECEGVGARTA